MLLSPIAPSSTPEGHRKSSSKPASEPVTHFLPSSCQDFQPREWPCVSQYIPDSPTQTLLQALSAAKWRCFLAATRINFPDEDGWTWKTVDDIGMEGISEDLFQHGLRVVDIERITRRHDENSVCCPFLLDFFIACPMVKKVLIFVKKLVGSVFSSEFWSATLSFSVKFFVMFKDF